MQKIVHPYFPVGIWGLLSKSSFVDAFFFNAFIIIFGDLGDLGNDLGDAERGVRRDDALPFGVIALLYRAIPGDIIPEGILVREPECKPSGSSSSEEMQSEVGFKVDAIRVSQSECAKIKFYSLKFMAANAYILGFVYIRVFTISFIHASMAAVPVLV